MPIRVANWDRQQKFLDPDAAMTAGASLGPSAAVSALVSMLGFMNDWSLQWRVNKEALAILPTAKSTINSWAQNNPSGMCYEPNRVGVLLHVITAIGSAPWGLKAPVSFVAVLLGDAGLDFNTVFATYIRRARIEPSGPPNSTIRYNFFWYTLGD